MTDPENRTDLRNAPDVPEQPAPGTSMATTVAAQPPRDGRRENRRWWWKLFLQPLLFLLCGVVLIVSLGFAQRWGWIAADGNSRPGPASPAGTTASYICPMMCTPPLSEPGRCPVCGMELVLASSGTAETDHRAVVIDPAARRIANIRTVSVESVALMRTVRTVGELAYNEGSLKTIAAYVDGRLERLYADYTGVRVEQGDRVALVYSPRLYAAQVEYLLAHRTGRAGPTPDPSRGNLAQFDLSKQARQRLIELGMTAEQIDALEEAGEATSRLHLYAPNSGTVIDKLAVEGQYVQEGEAIYRLADLSTFWLMLQLFPEDAAVIRYGQRVQAEVQSLPGHRLAGRVAFIDPEVDPQTRTVGVRVVVPNENGLLRAGDYATATIEVPLSAPGAGPNQTYDPELANRWISPRHPHVIESAPGTCRECGVPLVPAAELGFTDDPQAQGTVLAVPRDAVLMAGDRSVLYVESESEPGRFEMRRVILGPSSGERIVVVEGVREGEQVATRGNFLIDSQMQLTGNPSLIDPLKAVSKRVAVDAQSDRAISAALAQLTAEDRALVQRQRLCPVADMPLGSMGPPPKVDVLGTPVFICCEGCRTSLLKEPEKYLQKLGLSPGGAGSPEDGP